MSGKEDLDYGATVKGFQAGQKLFNRYTLKRILGRGGMGVVWQARDEELDRDIALKFLPEVVLMDREAIRDLKRETRRSLELTHPNIVRIYDFVQDPRAAAIAMELVPGDTLAARKLEAPAGFLETSGISAWTRQLLEALEYAHTHAQVVHRDLKPANLMVDARGNLKIADFGIAASVSDSVSRVSAQLGSSGTPVYMSPQQMMGERPAVTDDIYAVGATLYELLTGKPPFYSGNVLMQVQTKVPPRLGARRRELDGRDGNVGEEIPGEWESTIAACLAKDAAARPQSAAEIAEKLNLSGRGTRRETRTAPSATAAPLAVEPTLATSRGETVATSGEKAPIFERLLVSGFSVLGFGTSFLIALLVYRDHGGYALWAGPALAVVVFAATIALATFCAKRGISSLRIGALMAVPAVAILGCWAAANFLSDRLTSVGELLVAAFVPIAVGYGLHLVLRTAGVSTRADLGRDLKFIAGFALLGLAGAIALFFANAARFQGHGFVFFVATWSAVLLPVWLCVLVMALRLVQGRETRPMAAHRGRGVLLYAIAHAAVSFWIVRLFWTLGQVYEYDWDTFRLVVESILVAAWVGCTWMLATVGRPPGAALGNWIGHAMICTAASVVFVVWYRPLASNGYGAYGASDTALVWPFVLALVGAVSGLRLLRPTAQRTKRFVLFDLVAAIAAGLAAAFVLGLDLPVPSYEAISAQPVWVALMTTFGLLFAWQLLTVFGRENSTPDAARDTSRN